MTENRTVLILREEISNMVNYHFWKENSSNLCCVFVFLKKKSFCFINQTEFICIKQKAPSCRYQTSEESLAHWVRCDKVQSLKGLQGPKGKTCRYKELSRSFPYLQLVSRPYPEQTSPVTLPCTHFGAALLSVGQNTTFSHPSFVLTSMMPV